MLVGIELIELTEPSDTLNYKPFFKHWILQNILHVFLFFIFAWSKIFCSKNSAVFYIFLIWLCVAFVITVLKILCFWCSFYKVIQNKWFISYSRYNLLGIAIKHSCLRNIHQYVLPTLCNILHSKNSKYMTCDRD